MADRGTPPDWWAYIENELDARGWTGADFERATHISRTRLVDWRKGKGVSVDNARQVAEALGQPLLTVLVAAGIITPEEAKQRSTSVPSPSQLTDDQLLGEVRRRMGGRGGALTREEMDAEPGRYQPLGDGSEPGPKVRRRTARAR